MVSKVILFLLSFLLSCNQLLPPPKIEEEKISSSDSSSDNISSPDKFKVGNCSYPSDKKFFVAVRDLKCPETEEKDDYFESTIPKNILGLEIDELDKLYVVDQYMGIFISSDGGKSFDNPTITGVTTYKGIKVNRGDIYVISDIALYYSTDGGENFRSVVEDLSGLKKIEILTQKQTVSLIGGQRSIVMEDYIYLLSNSKIDVYKKDGSKFSEILSSQICNEVCGLADLSFGSNGYWYVATTKGVSISTNNGKSFELKKISNNFSDNYITSVFFSPEGKVYFTSLSGAGEFNPPPKSPPYILDDTIDESEKFNKILIDSFKDMYIASTKGVYSRNSSSKNFDFYGKEDGLAEALTNHIKVDSKGNIFAGSSSGLSVSLK
jgi:hypothetical protein